VSRFAIFTLGFLIGFTVEVHVEAAERVQLASIDIAKERLKPHGANVIEEPRNCLTEKRACAVRVGEGRKLALHPGDNREWTIAEKSIVIRRDNKHLRLIEGSIRIRGSETVIDTEQGEITATDEVFVDRIGDEMTIVNTGREPALFKGRGWSQAYEIPSGMQATVDRPSLRSGQTAVDLPLPLDFDSQVVREARMFDGKKNEFPQRLAELVSLRAEAAIESAKLHQAVVERKIASVQAEEERLKKGRQQREARDRELRALFRKKVLNPE
jgi:hypothetical protein